MKNIIACRPVCYELPQPEAASELKSIGIHHVELDGPGPDGWNPVVDDVLARGMTVSSLGTGLTVGDPASFSAMQDTIAVAARYGTGLVFTAVALPDHVSYGQGIDELTQLARLAAEASVVLSIETHVPYGHNSEAVLRTMQAVRSPGVGYNYDTANIFYYNDKGTDGIAQLRAAAGCVTSVHLKESARGEPGAFDFPVFGTGIVRFDEVFGILNDQGFYGPFTFELEGPVVDGLTTPERSRKVKACLDHLRAIGIEF